MCCRHDILQLLFSLILASICCEVPLARGAMLYSQKNLSDGLFSAFWQLKPRMMSSHVQMCNKKSLQIFAEWATTSDKNSMGIFPWYRIALAFSSRVWSVLPTIPFNSGVVLHLDSMFFEVPLRCLMLITFSTVYILDWAASLSLKPYVESFQTNCNITFTRNGHYKYMSRKPVNESNVGVGSSQWYYCNRFRQATVCYLPDLREPDTFRAKW